MNLTQLVAAWLEHHAITKCPERAARGFLHWYISQRSTHNLPLSLGVVGRW